MSDIEMKVLGEYIPGVKSSISLNKLKKFVNVPFYIPWYKSKESNKVFPLFMQEISDLNPKWNIPGLISRNPFFDHAQIKYFAAYKDDEPVGRIMAFIDHNYNKENNENTGWIGLFESIEDRYVAEQIIDNGVQYLNEKGCEKVNGPAKFNANGEIGLLIDGFEKKPYFMEPYNPPYYQKFFESFGFEKENDWYSMQTDEYLSNAYMKKSQAIIKRLLGTKRCHIKNGFNIRNINFKDMKKEIDIIKNLYNNAWSQGNHPQFVKMTDNEMYSLASGLKKIALEELIFIAEKDKKPIGVSVSLPNINEAIEEYDQSNYTRNSSMKPSRNFINYHDLKRDISIFSNIKKRFKEKGFQSMRILILGVEKEYRKSAIDARLYIETAKNALSYEIKQGSGSQLADTNLDITNPLFKIGKMAFTWRVYSKGLR